MTDTANKRTEQFQEHLGGNASSQGLDIKKVG